TSRAAPRAAMSRNLVASHVPSRAAARDGESSHRVRTAAGNQVAGRERRLAQPCPATWLRAMSRAELEARDADSSHRGAAPPPATRLHVASGASPSHVPQPGCETWPEQSCGSRRCLLAPRCGAAAGNQVAGRERRLAQPCPATWLRAMSRAELRLATLPPRPARAAAARSVAGLEHALQREDRDHDGDRAGGEGEHRGAEQDAGVGAASHPAARSSIKAEKAGAPGGVTFTFRPQWPTITSADALRV